MLLVVERSLSVREEPGSIPRVFKQIKFYNFLFLFFSPTIAIREISDADMAFTNSNITKFAETQLPRREENNSNNRKYIQGGRRTLTSPAATFLLSFTIFKARIHLRLSESRFKILPPFFFTSSAASFGIQNTINILGFVYSARNLG